MDPTLYQSILDYKSEGRYLPNITKKEKNEVRRKATKFILEGELWMSWNTAYTSRAYVNLIVA